MVAASENGGMSGSYISLWTKGRTLMSFKCKSVSPKDFIHVIILRHTEKKEQANKRIPSSLASIHGARRRNYIKQSVQA